jgi:hypothetical protein
MTENRFQKTNIALSNRPAPCTMRHAPCPHPAPHAVILFNPKSKIRIPQSKNPQHALSINFLPLRYGPRQFPAVLLPGEAVVKHGVVRILRGTTREDPVLMKGFRQKVDFEF